MVTSSINGVYTFLDEDGGVGVASGDEDVCKEAPDEECVNAVDESTCCGFGVEFGVRV